MGTFREPIQIAHPQRPKKTFFSEAIVDTSATYTWIPEEILKRLGIKPIETRLLKIASIKVI